MPEDTWETSHRYSEFADLHKHLSVSVCIRGVPVEIIVFIDVQKGHFTVEVK